MRTVLFKYTHYEHFAVVTDETRANCQRSGLKALGLDKSHHKALFSRTHVVCTTIDF